MKQKNVAILCRLKSNAVSNTRQDELDTVFFRLMAYANAHKLNVVAYYELASKYNLSSSAYELSEVLEDLKSKKIHAVLAMDDNNVPSCYTSDNITQLFLSEACHI